MKTSELDADTESRNASLCLPSIIMKTSLITSAIAAAAVAVALALSSCAFQVNPDGSKSGTVDGDAVIRGIEILNQK